MRRRTFLQILIGLPFMMLFREANAFTENRSLSLDDFLRLSSLLTRFPIKSLDRTAGRLFYRKLSPADLTGCRTMLEQARRAKPPSKHEASDLNLEKLETRIVAFWFTGKLETITGTEVVMTSNCLAWQSMKYTTPPMTCHSNWWKKPT